MTPRQIEILKILAATPNEWVGRDKLRTTFLMMQDMYFTGYVEGAARPDSKGAGNFPHTNLWQITAAGKEALAAALNARRRR